MIIMNNERREELKNVLTLIKNEYHNLDCGIFFNQNWTNDTLYSIYDGECFQLNGCYSFHYFEIYGATDNEQALFETFYEALEKGEI